MSSSLITMLNPKAANMQIGSGGIPRYTPADIAMGLGLVEDELGAAILCYIHAPDMAAVQSPTLEERIRDIMFLERERRIRAEQKASSDLRIAQANYNAISLLRPRLADLQHLKSVHRAAKARLWPERGDVNRVYEAIRKSILDDLRRADICKTCNGTRESTNADGLVVCCSKCDGTGRMKTSIRKLAKKTGRSKHAFSQSWKDVYEFTYRVVNTALTKAQEQFKEATL